MPSRLSDDARSFVPDSALLVGLHPHQRQVPDLADRPGYVNRWRHRVRKHTRPRTPPRAGRPRGSETWPAASR